MGGRRRRYLRTQQRFPIKEVGRRTNKMANEAISFSPSPGEQQLFPERERPICISQRKNPIVENEEKGAELLLLLLLCKENGKENTAPQRAEQKKGRENVFGKTLKSGINHFHFSSLSLSSASSSPFRRLFLPRDSPARPSC